MRSKMMNYQQSKAYMADKNIKSPEEYQIWYNKNREYLESIGLPEHPEKYYSNPENVRTYFNDIAEDNVEIFALQNQEEGFEMARSIINKAVNEHGRRHKDLVDIIIFEMDRIQSKIKHQIREEIKRDCSSST